MGPFVAIGICTIAAYGFGFFLLKRVQAHLLEFFITLVASTLPMGIILSAGRVSTFRNDDDIATAIFFGLLPVCLVIGGSVWGISISNRLRIHNAWRRLSLMALGWGFVLALCSACGLFPLAIIVITATNVIWHAGAVVIAVFGVPAAIAVLVLAHRFEKRAPE